MMREEGASAAVGEGRVSHWTTECLAPNVCCHNFTNCRFIYWPFYDKNHMLISIFVANYPCIAVWKGSSCITQHYSNDGTYRVVLPMPLSFVWTLARLCCVTTQTFRHTFERRHSVVRIFYLCNRCYIVCTHTPANAHLHWFDDACTRIQQIFHLISKCK